MITIEAYCQGKRIVFSSPLSSCKENFQLSISCALETIKKTKPYLTLIGADYNFEGNLEFYGSLKLPLLTSPLRKFLLHQQCDIPTRYASTAAGHSVSLIELYDVSGHSKLYLYIRITKPI